MTPPETDSRPLPTRAAIADALVAACRRHGTSHLFGVPGGGSNLDVVGAAAAHGIEFVLTHTETAAAVMAGVLGELTGAPGACVATRGPGAASAVNGAAQALLDRQPLVLVTDCVASADRARVSHQRLDQQALLGPVTKASLVLDGADPAAPARAVALAVADRPGPVHVDLDPTATPAGPPPGVAGPAHPPAQRAAAVEPPGPAAGRGGGDELAAVLALVRRARRPVVVAGVGATAGPPAAKAGVVEALAALGAGTATPVLTTYKARGVVPDSAPWCAGVATGATIESPVLERADLIVGVGLDPVELIPTPWPYQAPVVLLGPWAVDDSTFFAPRLAAEVTGDLAALVRCITAELDTGWDGGEAQGYRRQANAELLAATPAAPVGLSPQEVVTTASAAAPRGCIATVDAGAHMLVAVPLWEVAAPGELLISSGLATMGFALPAAIAAALARPGRPVVCFTGDGGLGMALAELETLARLDLPVIVVVFNDAALSLIAAKQQPEGHGGDAAVTYRRTDFAAIARASGLRAERIERIEGFRSALVAGFADGSPLLLDVSVDPTGYPALLDAVRGPR